MTKGTSFVQMPQLTATYVRADWLGATQGPAWEITIWKHGKAIAQEVISFEPDLRPAIELLLAVGLWVREEKKGETVKPAHLYLWEKPE